MGLELLTPLTNFGALGLVAFMFWKAWSDGRSDAKEAELLRRGERAEEAKARDAYADTLKELNGNMIVAVKSNAKSGMALAEALDRNTEATQKSCDVMVQALIEVRRVGG